MTDPRTAALYLIAHGFGPLGGKLTSDDMRRIAREALESTKPDTQEGE